MSSLQKAKVNAVLFDLGETILSYGKVNPGELFKQGAKSSYNFLQKLGQPPGNFKSYCYRNLSAIRLQYWLSFLTRKDFDTLKLLKRIHSKKGIELEEEQWRQLVWLWYEPLSKYGRIENNLAETLTELKEKGLKLGILSNTFINGFVLEKHLSQFEILKFFDVKLYSYQFDWRKPNVRIFKAAAGKLGEKCENIMFVGDRIRTDIRPAMKAKMTAVLKEAFTNNGKKLPKGAFKIANLSELPQLIEKISGKIE